MGKNKVITNDETSYRFSMGNVTQSNKLIYNIMPF